MAIEKFFKSSKTIAHLRSAPLGLFVEDFCLWLQKLDFSRSSILMHLTNISHLNDYLGEKESNFKDVVTSNEVEAFFKAYSSRYRGKVAVDKHIRYIRCSINRFIKYLQQKGCFEQAESIQLPNYQPLLNEYIQWLSTRNLATRTLTLRKNSLIVFLSWLGSKATIKGLSQLTALDVQNFFVKYAKKTEHGTKCGMQSALRAFLRFCFQRHYIQHRLDDSVPTLRTYQLSTVPHGLSETQAIAVLDSVDRTTSGGKRNYAILQLLYTYGVRNGQVRALQLHDIHWEKDQILFKASKQGKDSLLPLTQQVGESLLDYLKYSRPECSYEQVFLTCHAPIHPIDNPSILTKMVRIHIQKAGIDIPMKGTHVFRHGFASRMIARNHSLKEIADVLGHRHLSTTFIYTKVDFKALTEVALPWPEEK